jgi:uncharacterized protein YkwD
MRRLCAPLIALLIVGVPIHALAGAVPREVASAFEKAGRRPPTSDPALDRAAELLAVAVLREGAHAVGSSRRVASEVSRSGGFDPNPRALLVRASTYASALEELRNHPSLVEGAATHVGLGTFRSGYTTALVALLVTRIAEMEPFPRQIPAAGPWSRNLCGRLEAGYERPQVVITRPEGNVDTVPARSMGGSRVCASVAFPTDGIHRVELMVRGPRGPSVGALFDVGVGEVPKEPVRKVAARQSDTAGSESDQSSREAIVERMNTLRATQGASALSLDSKLTAIAQAYSDRMAREGFFAHVSPDGSTLRSRVTAAGYAFKVLGENLGAAATALAAHETIEDSPAHRDNILQREFTRVGIGIARRQRSSGSEEVILTQVFARPLGAPSATSQKEGPTKPRDDRAAFFKLVNDRRAEAGVSPLREHQQLAGMAQAYAEEVHATGAPATRAQADAFYERMFREVRGVRKAAFDMVVVEHPEQLPASANLLSKDFRYLAIGVVRGDSARFGRDMAWAVVLYAGP